MTTQPSAGGKKAASPNPTEIIHLQSDHNNIGESETWCGAEFVPLGELAEATCITCLKAAKIYGEGAATRLLQLPNRQPQEATPTDAIGHGPGREKLWTWFELSYASFLTLPRVLMHEMPDEWQGKMADLLNEYNETFPNQPDIGTRVQITDSTGHLIPCPAWLTDYRHPNRETIAEMRGSAK